MLHNVLKDQTIILASSSPRRKEILNMLGLSFKVLVSDIDEPITDDEPQLQAMMHAENKAMCIAKLSKPVELVVAADTIVVLDGKILGKPVDAFQAREYLSILSGRDHLVYTGICTVKAGRVFRAFSESKVEFACLSMQEIEDYVSTEEPMDKAGAYGIQGFGAQFITRIEGCYFNVMGFPVQTFYSLIKQMRDEALI